METQKINPKRFPQRLQFNKSNSQQSLNYEQNILLAQSVNALLPMTKVNPCKILLINCNKLYAMGLEQVIINDFSNVQVDSFCIKPTSLEILAFAKPYDLVIVDLDLKTDDLIQALEYLKKEMVKAPILLLTALKNKLLFDACKNLHIEGYLLKNLDTNLMLAIKNLLHHEEYYSPHLLNLSKERIDYLTDRELQVLKQITLGFNNAAIAQALFISIETVKTHKRNIREKLNITSIHGLIQHYIEHYS